MTLRKRQPRVALSHGSSLLTLELILQLTILLVEHRHTGRNQVSERDGQVVLVDALVRVEVFCSQGRDELVIRLEGDRGDLMASRKSDLLSSLHDDQHTWCTLCGMVALNSKLCLGTRLASGRAAIIFISSFRKPWSSRRSASSRTRQAE